MPSTKKKDSPSIEADKALAGVLALLVAEREERNGSKGEPRKTELILAGVGLSIGDIANATGKSYDAVKQTLRRGKS